MDRTFFHVLFPSIVIARFFRFYKPLSTTNFSIKDFLNSKFVFLMNEINLSKNLIKGLFSFNTTDISSFAILYSLRSFRVLSFEMIIKWNSKKLGRFLLLLLHNIHFIVSMIYSERGRRSHAVVRHAKPCQQQRQFCGRWLYLAVAHQFLVAIQSEYSFSKRFRWRMFVQIN